MAGATQAGGGGAGAGALGGGAAGAAAAVEGSEAAYWKGMFEELSAMRNTVPEEQLKLFKEHAAERDQNAEKYIQQLRCAIVVCVRARVRVSASSIARAIRLAMSSSSMSCKLLL